MPEFVHTCGNRRGCQSAHSHYHASKGNPKNFKNNIHHQGYQAVAEHRRKVRAKRHARLLSPSLRGRSRHQRVQAPAQPPKIQPSESGTDKKPDRPCAVLCQPYGDGRRVSDQQRQPGNPPLGARRSVDISGVRYIRPNRDEPTPSVPPGLPTMGLAYPALRAGLKSSASLRDSLAKTNCKIHGCVAVTNRSAPAAAKLPSGRRQNPARPEPA